MKYPKEHESLNNGELLKRKRKKDRYLPLQITIIYAFFGIIWINLSDVALYRLVASKEYIRQISITKGWIYVFITALLIYGLIRYLVKRLKKEEDKLFEYAYEDHLTQLPNRRLFYSDLVQKTQNFQEESRLSLLLIDVDNFKYVNDLHGHNYGDGVIVEIANRLKELVQEQMFLYRIGGDEFAIFIEGIQSTEEIKSFAISLRDNFKKNFQLKYAFPITISIGIAILPDHTLNMNDLVRYADVALYKAKEAGKNTYMLFEATLKKHMEEKIIYENKLKQALENDEFVLYYQPQIDLITGEIRGFEALIRWISKDLGLVSPAKFIPIAEETKLIIEIGKWVLDEAVLFISQLNNEKNYNYTISVNISAIQWLKEDFEEMITDTLNKYNFPASNLELEITESILINSFEGAISKMNRLRKLGIKVALDDFGTGYSSLNYLKQMPITTLKIDKTFIDDIFSEKLNQAILNTIIALGHTIGLEVVAEGVETQEQVQYLFDNQCDNIQGYFFSKPVCESDVQGFINEFKYHIIKHI